VTTTTTTTTEIVITLNTPQANKLLAAEMDFWRRSTRKSRKEKFEMTPLEQL
jgi:hypothetical protein